MGAMEAMGVMGAMEVDPLLKIVWFTGEIHFSPHRMLTPHAGKLYFKPPPTHGKIPAYAAP